MSNLNFGILSTASVNDYAFLPVVKQLGRVTLLAVASRDAGKAKSYAEKHNIRRAYGSYGELLADPDIDCVYIPLPVSMHKEWSIKALNAGKHVLCEKPVAANEAEALEIAAKVKETGLTFAEAFHYRYHPLCDRLEEIVRGGEIGEVIKIVSQSGVPLPDKNKVQFKPELAGGALLDIGCYPVDFSRWIAGCDDAIVARTHVEMTSSGVDGSMHADLEFANGVNAEINCSLVKFQPMYANITGSKGSIYIFMPFSPVVGVGDLRLSLYIFLVRAGLKVRNVRVPAKTTYYCQLDSFCRAVRTGRPPITNIDEAAANMRIIDAVYRKANEWLAWNKWW